MLASAKLGELKQLCAGTPAARYFEEGGERMLASILGTLAPAIGHLRLISRIERSEEHTSELQSLMRISYAVFCLKKKNHITNNHEVDDNTYTNKNNYNYE